MKGKKVLKILIGVCVTVLLILLIAPEIVGPMIQRKVQEALNENSQQYHFEIEKVHISLISSSFELEKITIQSKNRQEGNSGLKGEVEFVKVKGISLFKALFKNEYDIAEIIISKPLFNGRIPFPKKEEDASPTISKSSIRIGKVQLDNINVALTDSSTPKAFSLQEGFLRLYDIQIEQQDTIQGLVSKFDFQAEQVMAVSADSLYTLIGNAISYADTIKLLSIKELEIQPNYNDYAFTSRHKYETDRIEAVLVNIAMHNFPAAEFLSSGHLVSSYIEIGELEMEVFRDKRKPTSGIHKLAFQDLMYNYPGHLRIDSIVLDNGNITYKEHIERADEPGMVSINKLNASIYNIYNDTIYKTKDGFLKFTAQALLMDKGKMELVVKAKLYEPRNTFSVIGSLSELELKEMNSMLEKNAFVYATSGVIETMTFNFSANDTQASGQLNMLYKGLDLAVINKRTGDTTALKERIISLIANKKALNSNPMPGEEVRIGIIDYKRNLEKFFFNYCFKSILSGMKSSVIKNHDEKKDKKTLIQKIFGKAKEKKKTG